MECLNIKIRGLQTLNLNDQKIKRALTAVVFAFEAAVDAETWVQLLETFRDKIIPHLYIGRTDAAYPASSLLSTTGNLNTNTLQQ